MVSTRYCFTLDLKADPELISLYITHHKQVWPEVLKSIRDTDILNMEIYQVDTRLFMIMEAGPSFSFGRKKELDASNAKVREWEALMDQYQQRLPFAAPDEKWVLMTKIFEL